MPNYRLRDARTKCGGRSAGAPMMDDACGPGKELSMRDKFSYADVVRKRNLAEPCPPRH